MHIFREASALRAWVRGQKQQGHRVGFVPTMGNLHAGHFSLIEIARRHCDRIVASVFVNPTQFGEGEDFDRYPRTPDADAHGLRDHGCDALFLPEVGEIYPFGAAQGVCVHVPGLSDALEGAARPGHFDGVASVVCRLFNLVQPDLAVFGSKDYQQLLVVRRMASDLGFPLEILGAPIVREANGLAMSSRNQYLDAAQREQAAIIHATLRWMCERVRASDMPLAEIERKASTRLSEAGFLPDYAVLRNADDLSEPNEHVRSGLVALLAARLGPVRLIDNMACDPAV
ncbi:MAG TPA: pantoate--beta-alanine ligase [Dokdonella sp.]|mgnify:FL=1|jgi:pantoate--beta-alanine ligase|uniref:pantoate--beta-alanine ligase n=1 Tax=Dokdonella sp. TaxID=2291710 RepID=UPI002B9CB7E0|nr:pantoate--beta-alanine ligase [Dokdonella sp.]HNV07619.1 pantoate--beta-alanine ligase [Dokdonella sp.]HPW02998.1 pantoate--beta-alanine ligase [Dokdonella sp.]